MVSVQSWLRALESEVGYTESPPNSNRTKFADQAGHINGYPWCQTFLVAVAKKLGLELPNESAYTPAMASSFQKIGRWVSPTAIQPGDIVFFDFPDSKRRIQHVGVALTGVHRGRILTVEGNTSPDNFGSQDNGGGVYRRLRSIKYVVGAGRPIFTEEEDDLTDEERDWLGTVHHELRHPESDFNRKIKKLQKTMDEILKELRS